jgi:hypothetical protein
MKTISNILNKPEYYNIYWDSQKNKLVILKSLNPDNNTVLSDELYFDDENLTVVFSISPYLIGMLKVLNIPFYKAKRRILSAINKDIKECNMLDRNSNLGNLLLNEFGISIA